MIVSSETALNALLAAPVESANENRFGPDFAAFLFTSGYLQPPLLARAERASQQSGERLDRAVLELGLLSEKQLAEALSKFLDHPIIELADFPLAAVQPDLMGGPFVRGSGVMPVSIDDNRVIVAVLDPLDEEPIRAVAYLMGLKIEVRLAVASDFWKAVKRLYADEDDVVVSDRSDEGDAQDLQRLRDNASEAPVVRLVNRVIASAIEAGASDIHFESLENVLQVRFRLDGILRTIEFVPNSLRAAVVSRIKIMAKLDIAERRLPQDGRLRIMARGAEIDFRLSTIPTARGESVVMRILDRSRVNLDFETLGFEPTEIASMRRLLALPNGIVLITGPTGSGKTTTLYAALKELNRDQVKIVTVEDPIEYQLEGINQIQVQPIIGLDFPRALRSILRQDPDIIMIGEIRDSETAKIAVQAALTGHLVLSSLHTNSAPSAITRLLDMGIEAFLLSSTIRGVVGQRLVRRRCKACGHKSGVQNGDLESTVSSSPACDACHGSGFSGRSTISEILVMDADLQQIIIKRGSDVNLDAVAKERGMPTMYEAGVAKADRGITTLEEVRRVTEIV